VYGRQEALWDVTQANAAQLKKIFGEPI
jgi:hypothetical protein